MNFRKILTILSYVIFSCAVLTSYTHAQSKPTIELKDYFGSTIFEIQHKNVPILLYLPSEKEMAIQRKPSYIQLQLNYTDKNNDIEFGERINAIFKLPLDGFTKVYQTKGVADVTLYFDELALPMRIFATLYQRGRGKKAKRYLQYGIHNLDGKSTYLELNEKNLEVMKNLSSVAFEVTNSLAPSLNTAGRISLDANELRNYFRAPDENAKQAAQTLKEAESKREAEVKAYRANALYSGLASISPSVIDDSSSTMPNHPMLDSICYEASFAYAVEDELNKLNARRAKLPPIDLSTNFNVISYQDALDKASSVEEKAAYQKRIDKIIESEKALRKILSPKSLEDRKQVHQSALQSLASRCMSADKISQKGFSQCSNSNRDDTKTCECVKEQLYQFWSKNAHSQTPVQYSSRSSGQQYNFAFQACRFK